MNNFSKNFTNKSPFKQEDPKKKKSLEHKAEELLNFPQEKARQRSD